MQQVLGCLQYLANVTRPDILQAVQAISHYTQDPGATHKQAVRRILRYLSCSQDLGIIYKRGVLELCGYSDSDFAGDLESRKSTSGIVVTFAGGPIFTKSKRQTTVALSTAEAELIALTEFGKEVKYFRQLLAEIGEPCPGPTIIRTDNAAVVSIAGNGDYKGRMRHHVGHRFIQELVKSSEVSVKYIETTEQVADILTKPLPRIAFEKLRAKLNVV